VLLHRRSNVTASLQGINTQPPSPVALTRQIVKKYFFEWTATFMVLGEGFRGEKLLKLHALFIAKKIFILVSQSINQSIRSVRIISIQFPVTRKRFLNFTLCYKNVPQPISKPTP